MKYLFILISLLLLIPELHAADSTFIAVPRYKQPSSQTRTSGNGQIANNVYLLGGKVSVDNMPVTELFSKYGSVGTAIDSITMPAVTSSIAIKGDNNIGDTLWISSSKLFPETAIIIIPNNEYTYLPLGFSKVYIKGNNALLKYRFFGLY